MTYLEAAHHILTQAQRPLHYRAITQRALDQGLINPTGLTPDATMGSRLYTETKEEGSLFIRSKEGRGIFGLAAWQPTGIDRQVQRINHGTRDELRRLFHTMSAGRFDALIGELLIQMESHQNTIIKWVYSKRVGRDSSRKLLVHADTRCLDLPGRVPPTLLNTP